jgi:hypothetical protein
MENAVRLTEEAFKAMYERGYRTWLNLYEMAIVDTRLPWDNLPKPQAGTAFPDHPYFPDNLAAHASFLNTIIARRDQLGEPPVGLAIYRPLNKNSLSRSR